LLINYQEYLAMYKVEDTLWWYQVLHDRVVEEVKSLPGFPHLKVLDAGCGTGGLMSRLKMEGVTDIQGFDFNADAVAFSRSRGLEVHQADIRNFSLGTFDVVISNDVLYQMDDHELLSAMDSLCSALHKGGVLISNNNAFAVFGGIHDIAVGSKRRFVKKDFERLLQKYPRMGIQKAVYWSFILSPLILTVRLLQKVQLRMGWAKEIKSDVSLPSPFLNRIFYRLCTWERQIMKRAPFGSSLFLNLRKG
jgi:SAM-dependent methyltransferase